MAVAALSEPDYRGALAVLREAGDVDGLVAFPEPVLDAFRRLVPCDVVTYHERTGCDGVPDLVFVGEPRGPVTPEIRAAHRRYLHQDPLSPADGARKISDFLSRREYRRLDLYQQVDRPLGVEHLLCLWLDPAGTASARLEFDRARRDFGERDRAVLDLLLPYLRQLWRSAIARRRWHARPSARAECLTPREWTILERVAEGKTNGEIASSLWISRETVRKHLENAYRKLGVHTRTEAVAAVFLPARH